MDVTLAKETGEQSTSIQGKALSLSIIDDDGLQTAAYLKKGVDSLIKQVGQTFDEPVSQADQLHKTLVAKRNEHLNPLKEAKKMIVGKIGTFTTQRENRLAEEKAKRQKAIDDAKAEQERKDALAIEQAAKAKTPAAAQKILRKAEAESVPIPPSIEEVEPSKTSGLSVGKTWFAELTDVKAFCQAVVDGKVPEHYVEANMKILNALAKALKREDIGVPGCIGKNKPLVR